MRIAKRKHDEPVSPAHNMEILRRRVDWLDQRIEQAHREKRNPHFDISERDALKWALDEIARWVEVDDDPDYSDL